MTSTAERFPALSTSSTATSAAGVFVGALAAQDFPALRATLSDDVRLRALVPRGVREARGPEQVCATFETWFGGLPELQVVDASVDEVGASLHLRWRVRVRGGRFGNGWHVVEQQVYSHVDGDGRFADLALLCSGFALEASGGPRHE
jgi:SnoaL-like domain